MWPDSASASRPEQPAVYNFPVPALNVALHPGGGKNGEAGGEGGPTKVLFCS